MRTLLVRPAAQGYGALEDPALCALVVDGDGSALDALYDRHGPPAYALARHVLDDDELAQDVVREVFVTVWRDARRYEPGRGAFRTWLLTLTQHRAVDAVRVGKRRAPADLPEGRRDPLGLAYFGGYTQREIAILSGSPLEAVKSGMLAALMRPGPPTDHTAWDELAAGYAVNALEPEDEHDFTAHLRGCDRCRDTLDVLHEAAAELARTADPVEPPPGLRRRILAAAAAEREPAPRVTPPAPRAVPVRVRRASVAGVVAALALVSLVGWTFVLRTENAAQQAALDRRTAALRCLAAPDTATFDLTSGTGQLATSCLAPGRAYVVTAGLAPNDTTSSVYVLWRVDGNGVRHAVERFDVESDDTAVFELPLAATPSDVRALVISLEPGRAVPAQPTRVVASGAASP